MKKELIFIFAIILFTSLVVAQNYKLEVSTIPEDKIFRSGETIQLKITLYDLENNLVKDNILLILRDIRKEIIKEIIIQSNIFQEIQLPENILAGEGKIIFKYKDVETTESFFIEEKELAKFELDGEKLIITNIGNTKYNKKVYITIGETTGTKTPELNIGESVSYRLIAPEGNYNIQIKENEKIVLIKSDIKLTGTGQVIGALSEDSSKRVGLTGGISPEEGDEEALLSYAKNSKFIYVFMLTLFGAMILLAIER